MNIFYTRSTGEITMKLKQSWKSELADHASPAYQILAGNLATAVSKALFSRLFLYHVSSTFSWSTGHHRPYNRLQSSRLTMKYGMIITFIIMVALGLKRVHSPKT